MMSFDALMIFIFPNQNKMIWKLCK